MLSIGITGSYGTGKSTVTAMFARLGGKVIDADKIVHQMISPKGICFKRIVREFGKDILSQGKIDRKKLAGVVFENRSQRKKLELIIHPQVRREIKRKVTQYRNGKRTKIVVIDIPLLFESGHYKWLDYVVVVKANKSEQIRRSINRKKVSKNEVLKRIKSQMSISRKIRMADYIVDNRGARSETRKQVKQIWNELLN